MASATQAPQVHVGPVWDVPRVAGFVASDFAPTVYDAARRCLTEACLSLHSRAATAVILLTPGGDTATRHVVRQTIDNGARLSPLLFVQSTPSSIVGRIARDWDLRGAITTLATSRGLDDETIYVVVEEMASADGLAAVLVIRQIPRTTTSDGAAEAALWTFDRRTK